MRSRDKGSWRACTSGIGAAVLAVVLACIPAGQGRAETLKQALAAAYKFNPRLYAARATHRATDEEVHRALSGYRPSVNGSADTSYEKQITDGRNFHTNTDSNPRGYTVGAVQPLFRGFRTVNAVNAAEATARAGWETLLTTEALVLLDAVLRTTRTHWR